jgi:hypothetical protein
MDLALIVNDHVPSTSKAKRPHPIFSIYEVVGLLLGFLDARSLMAASTVNSFFHHIVGASRSLRSILFINLISYPYDAEIDSIHVAIGAPPEHDMMLSPIARVQRLILQENLRQQPPNRRVFRTQQLHLVRLNPFLVDAFPSFFPKPVIPTDRNSYTKLPWNKNARSIAAFAGREATWRNMQLSDPPVMTAHMHLKWSSNNGQTVVRKETTLDCGPKGLKMGRLYDVLHHLVVENGRFFPSGQSVEWGQVESPSITDRIRQQRDWDNNKWIWVERLIDPGTLQTLIPSVRRAGMSTNHTTVIQINVDYFHFGMDPLFGALLDQFKSEAAEEVDLQYEEVRGYF